MGKSCKVVVCGQASVGKTAILEQLLYGNHVVGEWQRGGEGERPCLGLGCGVWGSPLLLPRPSKNPAAGWREGAASTPGHLTRRDNSAGGVVARAVSPRSPWPPLVRLRDDRDPGGHLRGLHRDGPRGARAGALL